MNEANERGALDVGSVFLAIASGRVIPPGCGTCVVIEVSWGRVRRFGDEQ